MKKDNWCGFEILSQAPTRISFAGGGTDVSPYPEKFGGAALNATISIYMTAQLRLHEDPQVVIQANTRPEPMVYPSVEELEFDGQLDFIKAIVRRMYKRSTGFELFIHSCLPMQSGLGGSAAMCVAILGAFNHLLEASGQLDSSQLAELAFDIETNQLGNASGRQDQYASAFGGINLFKFAGDSDVAVKAVDFSRAGSRTLNHALVLFCLGARKPSGRIINDHVAGIREGGAQLEATHNTKKLIPEMLDALQAVDIHRIGELLDVLWQQKKCFSKFITNDRIDMVYSRLQKAGMIGGKVTGAGGGGHMLACCQINQRDQIIATAEELGIRPVPFTFVQEGVLSWESPIRTAGYRQPSNLGMYVPAAVATPPLADRTRANT